MPDGEELGDVGSGISIASEFLDQSPFFFVAPPLERKRFLDVRREVLERSLLVFSPLGLPRSLQVAVGSEESFLQKYSPRFRSILDAVSEEVYARHGVSGSEMAVSMYKYIEEEKNQEVLAEVAEMVEGLRSVYAPPKFLELQSVLSPQDLACLAVAMEETKALYRPGHSRSTQTRATQRPPAGSSREPMQNVPRTIARDDGPNGAVSGSGRKDPPSPPWVEDFLEAACSTYSFRETLYPEVFASLGVVTPSGERCC
ncbi:unnamed protein product, partial [Discosporangium mesarthrocarpum]